MADGLSHSRKAALSTVMAQISGTNADLPVLFTAAALPGEMFDADGSHPAQADGGDIRFSSDADGDVLLPCEVVAFATDADPVNGVAEIWVRLPHVRASQSDTIYVWYDTPTTDSQPAAAAANGSNAVWGDYIAVYHGGSLLDATGNGHDLSAGGDTRTTAGPFNAALDLDSNDYFEVSGFYPVTGSDPRGVSYWFKKDGGSNQVIMEWGAQPYRWTEFCSFDNRHQVEDGSHYNRGTALIGDGDWHYIGTSFAGYTSITDTAKYFDGAADGSYAGSSGTPSTNTGEPFTIGRGYANGSPWRYIGPAALAEIRLSASALDADRHATEYANQAEPAAFITVGTPSSVAGASVSLAVADGDHDEMAETVFLREMPRLAVNGASHGVYSDVPTLLVASDLAIEDCVQATASQSAGLAVAVAGRLACGNGRSLLFGADVVLRQLQSLGCADGMPRVISTVAHLLQASSGAPVGRTLGVPAAASIVPAAKDIRTFLITTNK